MARVVVDPITRIEGHLRIELIVDEKSGKVTDAVSSGTMWRGIELILRGRDPRDAWAFTQRICGVCTSIHAFVSVRAVEDALEIKIPKNANYIRNIMYGTLQAHDHTVHFYHLHALDWVSPVEALKATLCRLQPCRISSLRSMEPLQSSCQTQSAEGHTPESFQRQRPATSEPFRKR